MNFLSGHNYGDASIHRHLATSQHIAYECDLALDFLMALYEAEQEDWQGGTH